MTSTKVSPLILLGFLLLALACSATELRNLQGLCSNLDLPRCLQCVDNKVCTQCTPNVILNNGNCDCQLTEVIGCTDCFKSVFVPPFNGTNVTGAGTVISFICTGCQAGTILTDDKKSCDCTKTQVKGCSKCAIVNGNATCLQCFPPNLLSLDKKSCDCTKTQVKGCSKCEDKGNNPKCLQCFAPNLLSQDQKACDCSITKVENCGSCIRAISVTGPFVCLTCKTGTVLNAPGVCVDCASLISGCQTCQQSAGKTICVQCLKGKLLNNGICLDCSVTSIKDCIQCTTDGLSSTTCSQCQIGLILQNEGRQCNDCKESSIDNCRKCKSNGIISTCSQCKQGFFLSNGSCQACSSACRTCRTSTRCIFCKNSKNKPNEYGICKI